MVVYTTDKTWIFFPLPLYVILVVIGRLKKMLQTRK